MRAWGSSILSNSSPSRTQEAPSENLQPREGAADEAAGRGDSVYANSYVNLGKVDTVGFDFDYRLVTYTKELLELIYDMALTRLLEERQYPREMLDCGLRFDPFFSITGEFGAGVADGWRKGLRSRAFPNEPTLDLGAAPDSVLALSSSVLNDRGAPVHGPSSAGSDRHRFQRCPGSPGQQGGCVWPRISQRAMRLSRMPRRWYLEICLDTANMQNTMITVSLVHCLSLDWRHLPSHYNKR